MIECRQLSKRYGQKQVLENLSLAIRPHAFTMVLGANGAGKSTLMNILGRLIHFDEGDVLVDGVSLRSYSSNDYAKKCAILKQSNFIQLKLTVDDLVTFGRYPYSKGRLTKEDHQKVDEVIALCGCESFRRQLVDELSGGQKQRALLAMILAQDSEIILLDEPISNLDLKQSMTMMRLLKDVVDHQGKSVVMIVHDINIAAMFADEIILMKDGACIHQGSVDQMINEAHLEECYDVEFMVKNLDGRKISYIK